MSKNAKRYGMVIDLRKCIGCHACTISCKAENESPEKCFNTWVEEWDKGDYPDVSRVKMPKLCNHCIDAPCVEVCPADATFEVVGGSIVVDEEKCIGCGACVVACPYDARYIKEDVQKAGKCTFCIGRAEAGLAPACVSTCVSHARYFGDLNNPDSQVSQLVKKYDCKGLREDLGLDVSVLYIALKEVEEENPPYVHKGGK